MTASLLECALGYARRGWRVFPCFEPFWAYVDNTPVARCSCGRLDCKSIGKHPRIKGGCNAATITPTQIREWWTKWPDANIGIATGRASGLVVLDIDGSAGLVALKALMAANNVNNIGRTGVVATGRGWHLYFRLTDEMPTPRCSAGDGLDVRGEGGYVLAPPSLHPSGARYCWLDELTSFVTPSDR